MKLSREEVLRVAELAHLELSEAEAETYRGQLESILEYIETKIAPWRHFDLKA